MTHLKFCLLSLTLVSLMLDGCGRPEVVKEVANLTSSQVGSMNAAAIKELAFLEFQRQQIENETSKLQEIAMFYQFEANKIIGDWKAANDQEKLRLLDTLLELDAQTRKDLASAMNPAVDAQKSPMKGVIRLEQVQSALNTLNNDQKISPTEIASFASDVIKEFNKIQDEQKQKIQTELKNQQTH